MNYGKLIQYREHQIQAIQELVASWSVKVDGSYLRYPQGDPAGFCTRAGAETRARWFVDSLCEDEVVNDGQLKAGGL